MARHLDMLGLQYEFFEGVDGFNLNQEELLRVCNQKWANRHIGRLLLPGEIGCALSHLGVYRRIVDQKLPFALVLEDDAQLLPAVVPVLKVFEQRMSSNTGSLYLLSGGAELEETTLMLTGEYIMARVISAAYLAHAYVVSLEGAKRLLTALFPVVQVADDWGWISYHACVELFACHPAIATQSLQGQCESTIAGDSLERGEDLAGRWKRLNWWQNKLYLKWWRAVDRAGLGYYFWRDK